MNVKDEIKTLGQQMPPAEIASKSGVSMCQIYKMMREDTNPRINTLESILGVFGLELSVQEKQK